MPYTFMCHSNGHGQTAYLSFDLEHSVHFFSGRQSEIWKTKDQDCLWTGCITLVILPQRRIPLRRWIVDTFLKSQSLPIRPHWLHNERPRPKMSALLNAQGIHPSIKKQLWYVSAIIAKSATLQVDDFAWLYKNTSKDTQRISEPCSKGSFCHELITSNHLPEFTRVASVALT